MSAKCKASIVESRIITKKMGELPLEPGDTLLIQGEAEVIKNLRNQSHSEIN